MKQRFAHYLSPGIIGKALYDQGFRNIDAHDGAAAMVDFCRTTGHYNGFHTCFVGNGDKLTMEDGENLRKLLLSINILKHVEKHKSKTISKKLF